MFVNFAFREVKNKEVNNLQHFSPFLVQKYLQNETMLFL